jgi:hypothetical protein
MSCKEVVAFWLDMSAPISLPSQFVARLRRKKRRMPRQVALKDAAAEPLRRSLMRSAFSVGGETGPTLVQEGS